MIEKWTAAVMKTLLEARYTAAKGYELFFNVADRTAGAGRFADAIMFGSWPSNGLHFTGFEIKVARSDWLNEIKNPAKASSIIKFCKYWYLVAAPKVVDYEKDAIPHPWGVLEARADGVLLEKKKPVARDAEPPTPEFLASFLRSIRKANDSSVWIHRNDVKDVIKQEASKLAESAIDDLKLKLGKYQMRADEYAENMKVFNDFKQQWTELTGITLPNPMYKFDRDPFLRSVRLLQKHGLIGMIDAFRKRGADLANLVEKFNKMSDDLEKEAFQTREDSGWQQGKH